jgi:ubiquitin C-terminal hydrolase
VGIAEVRLKTVVAGRKRVATSLKHTKQSPRILMEVGLENLGNTCFMNSSLQCLLHIQPLVAYFLATNVCDVLNEKSPMKGLLASSFAQLVKDVFNASAGSSIAPMAFQKVVSCTLS